jgi:hypothetical protein
LVPTTKVHRLVVKDEPAMNREAKVLLKFDAVVMAAAVRFERTDRGFPVKVSPDQAIINRPL